MSSTFGQRLKYLRNNVNMTQQQIATLLGISTRQYQLYEADQSYPSFLGLITLSNYFGVSLDFLTGRSDDPRYEDFVDKAESALLSEAETLISQGINAEVNSNNELLGSVGNFIKGFYNSYKQKYTAPLAHSMLISETRKLANWHLNPRTVKVHLITPAYLRTASILNPKAYLQERGVLPQEVVDTKPLKAGEKTDIQLLIEELDKLEEEYKKSKSTPNPNT